MDLEKTLGGNYLKAADLAGQPAVLTISGCEWQLVGHGENAKHKAVVSFRGKEKKMVLNSTNSKVLIAALGKDTDAFAGKQIEVYPTVCDYSGKTVDCIRLRAPEKPSGLPLSAVSAEADSLEGSDSIPF